MNAISGGNLPLINDLLNMTPKDVSHLNRSKSVGGGPEKEGDEALDKTTENPKKIEYDAWRNKDTAADVSRRQLFDWPSCGDLLIALMWSVS